MSEPIFVGLDIGGTKTAVLAANRDQQALSSFVAPTQISDPEQLIAGFVAAIDQVLAQADLSADQIVAIGAGIPGRVVPETGVVHNAVNLNLRSYPVGPKLAEVFGVPVVMENDVRAATLGAYDWLTKTRNIKHMAYISIGTGISAGTIYNGSLYRGATGMAIEIGHIPFEPNGPLCACGMCGCLETLASGPGIARQFQERAPSLVDQAPTAKEVYLLAAQGQPDALAVIAYTSQLLASAAYMLVSMCDVEIVVFGGGVSAAGRAFLDPILAAISRMGQNSPLVRMTLREDMVAALPPGHPAATWGAIKLAQQVT